MFFFEASDFMVKQKFFSIFEQVVFKQVPGRLDLFFPRGWLGWSQCFSILRAWGTVLSLGRGPSWIWSCIECVTQSSWLWDTLIFIFFVPSSEYLGYFSVIFIRHIKMRREDKSPG